MLTMCVNVIKVSVYLQNWSHVISFVNKALNDPEMINPSSSFKTTDHLSLLTRFKCAGGLADLMTR